jgi:hypothetical protein
MKSVYWRPIPKKLCGDLLYSILSALSPIKPLSLMAEVLKEKQKNTSALDKDF